MRRGLEGEARAGGANTSHTIAVGLLSALLSAVPSTASREVYVDAAVEDNVLGRSTIEGRRRAVRYLRELYRLDPSIVSFRALRDLWEEDDRAQPLIAGLSAYAHDSVFQASGAGVLPASSGESVRPQALTIAVVEAFPDAYNDATAAKIGRNTGSSWTQTGHLAGRRNKVRCRVEATPASATYALLMGHLHGVRGQALYETPWAHFLDATPHDMSMMAEVASRRGYLELREGGGVVEIGFRHLLRPGAKGTL